MACHTKFESKPNEEEVKDRNIVKEYLGPSVETKFDELKYEVLHKIEKELMDSQNARDYISLKYEELCKKIQCLSELNATVTGFRSDVRSIEQQISSLALRVDDIEKRTICKECPSIASSKF